MIAGLSSVMLLAASPETVTVSFTPPTSSVTSTNAVPAALTSTFVCSNFLKLGVTTSTRYVPGLRFTTSYRPSASVSTLRGVFVASSVINTAAPLTAPPWGSTTVPRIVPRNDWAPSDAAKARAISSERTMCLVRIFSSWYSVVVVHKELLSRGHALCGRGHNRKKTTAIELSIPVFCLLSILFWSFPHLSTILCPNTPLGLCGSFVD